MTQHGRTSEGPSLALRVGMAAIIMGLGCLVGCQSSDTPAEAKSTSGQDSSTSAPAPETGASAEQPATVSAAPEARAVLEAMVAAYRGAKSYNDKAAWKITGKAGDDAIEDGGEYLVVWEAPNKIRIQINDGMAVSDGQTLWAYVVTLSNQVLKTDAPAKLDVATLYADHELASALSQGPTQMYSWLPLQLVLLWANDPLKTLLNASEPPTLLAPEKIAGRDCDRVEIKRADGTGVFWIDRETHLLRRFEFPTAQLRELFGGDVRDLAMTVDFADAQLNGNVDARAFQFETPEGVAVVPSLTPQGVSLLGKPAGEFKFTDLEGKEVTLAELRGKPAVIDLWATWCAPCRQLMPLVNKVHLEYGEKANFLAVSVDAKETSNDEVVKVAKEIGAEMRVVRDPDDTSKAAFGYSFVPTMVVLDEKGVVQAYETGGTMELDAQLSARLERLLAGEEIYRDGLDQYENQRQMFRELREQAVKDDLFVPPTTIEQPVRRAELAARSEPETLKITQLWRAEGLKAPGNIVAVKDDEHVLVLDGENTIVEVDHAGKAAAKHTLSDLAGQVHFLRTADTADGKRLYVASSSYRGSQLYLFDDQFKQLLSYPKDPAENPYGIGDARLADLDGDGELEICAGFWELTGVHAISLDGTVRWKNRAVANAVRLAVLGPDDQGHRNLLVTNSEGAKPGTLAVLSPAGERVGDIAVPGRSLAWVAAQDLDGDGQPEICALAALEGGDLEAIGLGLDGKELWSYPLEPGAHEQPIDPVTAGPIIGDDGDEWIIASADGTIHLLTSDGALVDKFAYGKTLTGIAATRWDGKNVLLVSTPEGLEAWEVRPPD